MNVHLSTRPTRTEPVRSGPAEALGSMQHGGPKNGNEADVAIEPDILAILACPSADHAALREERRDDGDVLVCSFCATVYPIRDGIPVLLVDDATPGPNGIGRAAGTNG
jgi:uncharacterized protein YbaR (Trm112 family)